MHRACALWAVLLLSAAPAVARAETPYISEFLALNRGSLLDEDGDPSDWLEVFNPGLVAVDVGGWFLTDDPSDLRQWQIPARELPPGGALLVFASGKDRRPPTGELHTNFQLEATGDYLALVEPDGLTVAHEYSPKFPEQLTNVSYGIGQDVDVRSFVGPEAPLRVLVPSDGALGTSWTGGAEPFDDSGWAPAEPAVGYVTMVSGFAVTNFVANLRVDSLTVAEEVIETPEWQSLTFAENIETIDYEGTNAPGHYPNNRPFPGSERGEDVNDFVLEVTGVVTIPLSGAWTFGVLSDDGFGLDIVGGGQSFRIEHPAPRGPNDTLGVFQFDQPGNYFLRLVFYERGGGSGLELFAARGSFASWSTSFRLVGDTPAGGLAVRSELAGTGASGTILDLIGHDVESTLYGVNSSLYVRAPFTGADPAELESLTLRMRYDDGFAAYLNGVEIARRNAPASIAWDSQAITDRPVRLAVTREDIDVSAHREVLRPGDNILAVHALNDAPDSPEFLVGAELAEIRVGSLSLAYFDVPTPGEPNGEGYTDVVADTRFDPDRGFYAEPIRVQITTTTPGATIRFTMDGTEPTLDHGATYSVPVLIDRTTTLRAKAFRDGYLPTNTDTHSYFFLDDVVYQNYQATIDAGFPSMWGGTTPDYGLDPDVIGFTGPDLYGGKYAATVKNDLLALPTLSIVVDIDDMFGPNGIYTNSTRHGVAYERPASVEYIRPDGTPGFQIDCGIRIQGGAFRSHNLTKKHSLRLLFKAIYGAPKLEYPLFGDDAATSFDTLTLRANSNDGYQWASAGSQPLFIRDSFGRETGLAMGQVHSHEVFVHLYLNGIYWGLYNPVERPDAAFAATYFGGDKDEWDAISHGSVSDGNPDGWNTLLDLSREGLGSDAQYEHIQGNHADGSDDPNFPSYLDVENLADYMIVNLYGGNTDWPHKNYWTGRRRVDSTGFKFYMWDAEWSLGIRSNLNTNRVDVSNGVAEPYAEARANEEFRVLVGDRLHRHFFNGGALYVAPSDPSWDPAHPERNVPAARFMRLANTVDRAIVPETARWGDQHEAVPYTRDEHWEPERDSLLAGYFPQRTSVVLEQFRSAGLYPPVAAPSFHQHGGVITPGFELVVTALSGSIYVTTDTSDPRLRGGAVNPEALALSSAGTTLVASGADVWVHVPQDDSLGLSWTQAGFSHSSWTAGRTGVGYDTGAGYDQLIETDVEDAMYGKRTSVYLRVPFTVEDPSSIASLTLAMKYDDGYVAYLNGSWIAERNPPEDPPTGDSAAGREHADSEAVVFDPVEIPQGAALLEEGTNVLAIHGLNRSTTSSDLLILPELWGSRAVDDQAIVLGTTTLVRARARVGSQWSALNEAVFVVESARPLRVSELMYHPPAAGPGSRYTADEYEFIELQNVGDAPLDLAGIRISGGIELDLSQSPVTVLQPGAYIVAVENLAAFASRYGTAGIPIAGQYTGRLGNAGDRVRVTGPFGETLLDFRYADTWYPSTDGGGFSLQIRDPLAAPSTWGSAASWRASAVPLGTPGTDDGETTGGWRIPGDANSDALLDISDVVSLLLTLYVQEGRSLPCGDDVADPGNRELLDLNDDVFVDVSDAVYLLEYLFLAGPPPARGTTCRRMEGCPDACWR